VSQVARRSWFGLNAVNFFLAEVLGVIIPFLVAYLRKQGWSYEQIGVASAAGGFGTMIAQAPAGFFCDRFKRHRLVLGLMSLLIGVCYGAVPLFAKHIWQVDGLLFVAGVAGAFFNPLLASLALSVAGKDQFDSTMGVNQSWNHAGNIAAALLSLAIVKFLGLESIFFIMASLSVLAVLSLMIIRRRDLKSDKRDRVKLELRAHLKKIFKDRRLGTLLLVVGIYYFATAPILPLLSLYIKNLGGGDDKVSMIVLISQVIMIPTSLLAGRYVKDFGRKPVLALAFLILPLRIFLYLSTTNVYALLAIQALDGIGAGIYGVLIALVCSDLAAKGGGLNSFMGLAQTSAALAGVAAPLVQGYLTQHYGFPSTFIFFGAIACVAAGIYIVFFPETKAAKA